MKTNSKITLTIGQLKRLVKEAGRDWFGQDFFTEGEMLIEYRGPGGDVVVPEGILSIAMPAFEGKRDEITSLSLPATLVQIAPSSLSFLRNIKYYSVAEGNTKFSSKNGMLLSKDGETLLHGIGGDAVIPDGVKEIADEAFAFLNLKSVVIPEGVTSIGEVAFCGCEDLTKVVIPSSVEILKEDAFRDCAGLGKVDMLNPKLEDEVMQDPSKCFRGTPWSSTDEQEVKETYLNVENSQGLIDQVLEDPRVQMAAEQFVNCLIENVVTAPTFRTANPHAPMLSDVISNADDIRWKRVVSAINLVKMNYKGAK